MIGETAVTASEGAHVHAARRPARGPAARRHVVIARRRVLACGQLTAGAAAARAAQSGALRLRSARIIPGDREGVIMMISRTVDVAS